MSEYIVETNGLTKSYGTTVALYNVNLKLEKGKIIGLLGPNGSGKTTFIKILTNLLNQYTGEVFVDGKKPGVETKKTISYLPDVVYLDKRWTANQAIEFFKEFYSDFDEQKARRILNQLNIPLNKRFKELSKGTKEKLQLVLVLSREAELYIFDEPIAGVDPAARDLVFKLIRENYNQNASIILSTHLIADAETIIDDVLFLKNGEIVLHEEANALRLKEGKTVDEIFREVFRCL